MSPVLSSQFDWSRLGSLRLRSAAVADGLYVGTHRSARPGVGVEFGGHRNYVPGDDLRWLDRHALMRHGRLMIREFETETDRSLRLVVDATASMGYRSGAVGLTKFEYAVLLAAVIGRVSLAGGDRVALDWMGGGAARWLPPRGGKEAFFRLLEALERVEPQGDATVDPRLLDRAFGSVARYARRGSSVVVLTDGLDFQAPSVARLVQLANSGRLLVVIRILDPAEEDFPFGGSLRLRSLEGSYEVMTSAPAARSQYRKALRSQTETLVDALVARGGRWIATTTARDPVEVVREFIRVAGEKRW